jgi:hypothetical protein
MIRAYSSMDAAIVSGLDLDLLVDYCLLMEQVGEIDLMRQTTYRMWLEIGAAHDQAIRKAKEAADAAKAAIKTARETGEEPPERGLGSLAEVTLWEERAVNLALKAVDAFDAVVKLDARTDAKRKTLLAWRQSLYLTPRARAGVAPSEKPKEEPLDPMEQLLGDVTNYVNKNVDQ